MRPLTDIFKKNSIKSFSRNLLIITSLVTLVACGSDDEAAAAFIAPKNAEPLEVALTGDDLPAGFAYAEGVTATFYANEVYGPDTRNVFDIFLPESDMPTGLVIYVHGGGFFMGDKSAAYYNVYTEGSDLASADINAILASGSAFATINYSLLTVPGFNAALDAANDTDGLTKSLSDIKEALQYIRYNADNFNIDPTKVAMYGVSAGAVSSLWLAYSDDMAEIESEDPVAQQSTRLAAAAGIETQGSLDLVRWEEILTLAGVTLDQAAALGAGSFMESVYGLASDAANGYVNTLTAIREESGELAEYRATLDLPALIDKNDPPVFVSNVSVNPFTVNLEDQEQAINALLHFPTHAKIIKEYGDEAGAEVILHMPTLNQPSEESIIPFLIENL